MDHTRAWIPLVWQRVLRTSSGPVRRSLSQKSNPRDLSLSSEHGEAQSLNCFPREFSMTRTFIRFLKSLSLLSITNSLKSWKSSRERQVNVYISFTKHGHTRRSVERKHPSAIRANDLSLTPRHKSGGPKTWFLNRPLPPFSSSQLTTS